MKNAKFTFRTFMVLFAYQKAASSFLWSMTIHLSLLFVSWVVPAKWRLE